MLVLGSVRTADIRLLGDDISSIHCYLECANGEWSIVDAGSQSGMQGQAFLDELTSVTGGKSFYPQTDVEMDEIFERISLELRHQYSIGYLPKDFEANGKYRKVKVKVKPPRGLPRLTVRGREGYYAFREKRLPSWKAAT